MKGLTLIKDDDQYYSYCNELEALGESEIITEDIEDRIEHLVLLIEAWDKKHSTVVDLNPVEYLKLLMQDNEVESSDLKEIGLSKSLVSHILNYRRGFSKNTIAVLSNYFKVSQEAFNRPYSLIGIEVNSIQEAETIELEAKIINIERYKRRIKSNSYKNDIEECLSFDDKETHKEAPLMIVCF